MRRSSTELRVLTEHVYQLILSRPTKKNAFNTDMYLEVTATLNELAEPTHACRVCVLTGQGDFYSSGNDLAQFMNAPENQDTLETVMVQGTKRVGSLVEAFIRFPKILIAAVNGPSIGIACTTLGLCDLVLASASAFFWTPFVISGQSPEGCSSVTFPRMLGQRVSDDMLLGGRRLSAAEALQHGFVNSVHGDAAQTLAAAQKVALELAAAPAGALLSAKAATRPPELIGQLMVTNMRELELLSKRFSDPNFMSDMMGYMAKRGVGTSKL